MARILAVILALKILGGVALVGFVLVVVAFCYGVVMTYVCEIDRNERGL